MSFLDFRLCKKYMDFEKSIVVGLTVMGSSAWSLGKTESNEVFLQTVGQV